MELNFIKKHTDDGINNEILGPISLIFALLKAVVRLKIELPVTRSAVKGTSAYMKLFFESMKISRFSFI